MGIPPPLSQILNKGKGQKVKKKINIFVTYIFKIFGG